jgi:hypothetical protein
MADLSPAHPRVWALDIAQTFRRAAINLGVAADGVTIGHSGDVVGDVAAAFRLKLWLT